MMRLDLTSHDTMTESQLNEILERNYNISQDNGDDGNVAGRDSLHSEGNRKEGSSFAGVGAGRHSACCGAASGGAASGIGVGGEAQRRSKTKRGRSREVQGFIRSSEGGDRETARGTEETDH